MVAIKIKKHQLLCTRKRLRMDGFDGVLFQVDAFNLGNCSQHIGLETCDTILTFNSEKSKGYAAMSTNKQLNSVFQ